MDIMLNVTDKLIFSAAAVKHTPLLYLNNKCYDEELDLRLLRGKPNIVITAVILLGTSQ